MSHLSVLLHGLMLLSGFAGLGYQVVWVRMLALGLGHEVIAVLAVVAAFFAGLAVGALVLDRRIARSARPGRWYVGLELAIGFWALALIWLVPVANGWLSGLMGPDPSESWRWTVAFVGPALLLLPATLAMGATLPAMERVYAARVHGGGVGGLYAANTAGAMAGALLTAVWLAPALGFTGVLVVFALVNLGCAAAMALLRTPPAPDGQSAPDPRPGLLGVLALTGFLGIGFEVAGVRALSQILENTVYSFAAALSMFLLATAVGATVWQRFGSGLRAVPMLIGLTGLGAALGILAVFRVADIYALVRDWTGPGIAGAMIAEVAVAALVFGPAALAMGAVFAALAQAARGPEGGLGAALAANTGGAALAPLTIGVIGVPLLGVLGTLLALVAGYVLLTVWAFARFARVSGARDRFRAGIALIPAAAALGLAGWVVPSAFGPVLVPTEPGDRIVRHVEGTSASASTIETAGGDRWLRVNGTFTMGGTASYKLDRLQAHAALMQVPGAERALFLGIGTGATVAAVAAHEGLRADAVDLSPEVLRLVPDFPDVAADLALAGDRLSLRTGDARRAVRMAEGQYDLILADTYHPARDGAGLLYTREHFAAIRERLTEGGLFVQWLPLHQLDIPTLKLIVRTYLDVFPDARMAMGNFNLNTPLIALYGSRDGALPRMVEIAAAEVPLPLRAALREVNLETPFALLGGFLGAGNALKEWAESGPLNTDDRPLVLFRAPRTVYAPLAPAHERLLALTDAFEPQTAQFIDLEGVPGRAVLAARVHSYWRARDAFLRLGVTQPVSGDLARDIRELAPRLLDVLRISPDFDPAYRPVLAMARAAMDRDRSVAEVLLQALARVAPHRPEAKNLLIEMNGS